MDIDTITQLFIEQINPMATYVSIKGVINQIVFDKGVGADYLLFGLKYYISKKIPLHYPQGLHYVINNKDVIQAWKTKKAQEFKSQMNKKLQTNTTEEEDVQDFGYAPKQRKSFSDILGA